MIDSNIILRHWLLDAEALTTAGAANRIPELATGGIFCPSLPEGFDPAVNGRAITLSTRGGSAHLHVPILRPSVQITCWAPAGQQDKARELYRAIFDLCHGAEHVDRGADGIILAAREEVQGQDITDPDTKWASVVTFYEVTLRATA